jgi:predicted nucleic acid-binding protein
VIRYLLDTNIISEVRKPRPHGGVLAWIEGLREDQLYISAVTIGELQRGVERARSKDNTKALAIESWLDQLEATSNVIPTNGTCFREWARLMEGKSDYLLEDAMIAATARVHALKVATRNEGDFDLFQVDVVNPFKTPWKA